MKEQEQADEGAAGDESAQKVSDLQDPSLLQQQLDEALREKDQFRTMAQRAQADLENYKKRAVEERQELRRSANEGLLLKLLAAVDDLERAIALIPQDAVAPGWFDGLLLVMRNVGTVLDSEGVHKVEALGLPFDPREFEAVQYEESTDTDEGKVVKVLRDGYRHHDRVLRAAQVIVARRPEPETGPEHNEEEPK